MRFWSARAKDDDEKANPNEIGQEGWLPDMDLNHDKQIQSLLCYRYTIGQAGPVENVKISPRQSSC